MNGAQQPDSKRRARSEPRSRGQIAVMVDLQAAIDLETLQHRPDGRMRDVGDFLDVLDDRIDNAEAVIEEGRELANADVAVLIDGRREHRAAMLVKPVRIVRASAEKRHPERGAADNHGEL